MIANASRSGAAAPVAPRRAACDAGRIVGLGRAGREALIAGALCAGAAALALWDALTGARILAGSDYVTLQYPFLDFAARAIRETGELPLWMPHLWCGLPFIGSMNSGVLYPTELLTAWFDLPAERVSPWDAVLHTGLAGAGVAWWLRREGFSSPAVRAGAIAYALSGVVLSQLGVADVNTHRASAWLPWWIEAYAAAGRGSGRGFAAAAVIAGAMLVDCGIQTLAFAVPWGILLETCRRPAAWFRLSATAGLVCLVGAAVGAVWFLPALSYLGRTDRVDPGMAFASSWSLSPYQATAVLWPGFWGQTSSPDGYFGPHVSDDTTRYPGLLAIGLAVAGAAVAWRRRRPCLFAGAVAFVLAFGPQTVLGSALRWIPGFGGFRGWTRWLLLANLSFVMLVAEGWETVFGPAPRRGRLACLLVVAAFTLLSLAGRAETGRLTAWAMRTPHGLAGLAEHRVTPEGVASTVHRVVSRAAVVAPASLAAAGASFVWPVLGGWPLLLALGADLALSGRTFAVLQAPERLGLGDEVGPWLADQPGDFRVLSGERATGRNVRMRHGIEMVRGYHGLPPRDIQRFLHVAFQSLNAYGILALLNVRYVVQRERVVTPGLFLRAERQNYNRRQTMIYELRDALPRVMFPTRLVPVPGLEEALEIVAGPGWTWRTAAVTGPALPAERLAAGRMIGEMIRTPNDRWIRYRAAGEAFVLVSEIADSGWHAFVDGRRTVLRRTDGVLMGVPLLAGEHVLRLRRDPMGFRLGLWLSVLTLVALAAGAALARAE